MSVISDLCRKITALQPAQIEVLDKISLSLDFVADLAHAQVTIYARTSSGNFLVIVDQAKPNTTFVYYKTNLLGTTMHAFEEPLVWRTITAGKRIVGQREWALGMDVLEMQVFPLYDAAGSIIAAASFEYSNEEAAVDGHNLLVETGYDLLTRALEHHEDKAYRHFSVRDGLIIVDHHDQIVFANSAARSIYKVLGVGKVVGRRSYERQLGIRLVQKAALAGRPMEVEVEIGNMILAERAIPIVVDGRTISVIAILSDITELKKKEKELLIKSAVIQEIHHRVKNNLQTIASLLRLQARRTKSAEVKAALRESVNRILSISVVHEFLSQQDQEFIDVAEVAKNILDTVIQNMLEPDFNLQTVFNGETVILPSEQASSLALVINELIQNSIEHAFVGQREGIVGVDIATFPDEYQIDIYDNGIGLPADFSIDKSNSLGLQIVRTLIENDLGGKFNLYSDNGSHARIIMPRKEEVDK